MTLRRTHVLQGSCAPWSRSASQPVSMKASALGCSACAKLVAEAQTLCMQQEACSMILCMRIIKVLASATCATYGMVATAHDHRGLCRTCSGAAHNSLQLGISQ